MKRRNTSIMKAILLLLVLAQLFACSPALAAGKYEPTPLPKKPEVYLEWKPFRQETPPLPVMTVEKEGGTDRVTLSGVAAWGVDKEEMIVRRAYRDEHGWTWRTPKEYKNKTLPDQVVFEDASTLLGDEFSFISLKTSDNGRLHIRFKAGSDGLVLTRVQISDGGYRTFYYDSQPAWVFDLTYEGKGWMITAIYDGEGCLTLADYSGDGVHYTYHRASCMSLRYQLDSIYLDSGLSWTPKSGWKDRSTGEAAKEPAGISPDKLPFTIVGDPQPAEECAMHAGTGYPALMGTDSLPAFWPAEDLSKEKTESAEGPDGTSYRLLDDETLRLKFSDREGRDVYAYYTDHGELYQYIVSVREDGGGTLYYTYSYEPSRFASAKEPVLISVEERKEDGGYLNKFIDLDSPTGWKYYNMEAQEWQVSDPPRLDLFEPLPLKLEAE